MGRMSDKDWEALLDNFDTNDLLSAVDCLEALRGHLNDRADFQPPEIRGELLKLHGLAMKVIGEGALGGAEEMFDLAEDLEDQVTEMMDEIEQIADTLGKLTALRPKSLDDA
ncbi:MAG: transposase [Alphaproteobacteria bacterium]|nr:transposase [Alphaproteobacteria bacterium]